MSAFAAPRLSLKRRLSGHDGPVSRARWSSDGKYVMTCSHDKTLRLWNPHRSDETMPATAAASSLSAAASSSGAAAAPAEARALQIKEYSGPHGYEVVDCCLSADNSSFVSCGGDRAAFMWDVSTGRVLRRFEGHTQRINAVTYNAEDSVMLTASYDQTVRWLWWWWWWCCCSSSSSLRGTTAAKLTTHHSPPTTHHPPHPYPHPPTDPRPGPLLGHAVAQP